MKGLAILGSPHNNGNNAKILKRVIDSLKEEKSEIELEYLQIKDLEIQPCVACYNCKKKQGCVIDDDMIEIYSKLDQADLIILASPIYFNTVTAQLKALIDRCQALWANKFILKDPLIDTEKKRIGAFISTAGEPLSEDSFKYVVGTLDLFFKGADTEYYDNFFVPNIDNKSVTEQSNVLQDAEKWGKDLAEQL
ncbi:flavodoxin family protein [Natroniella sulfidigena]|uniref:flavodoxin family protein n=1 Tax=Natroniella sulfidigena TaxID=723921 RepID=UPI00200A47DB|nr:flavodoxin family protein [Natroniella sulfidigena]MCK8815849.1 flavodoxin family protein [Natroniella sulfidigena]